jgi:endonuclease/exonuclease/phosphatase family metal-dependent hydrolase
LYFKCIWALCGEEEFWDRLALGGLLDTKNLILAGDLNFTIGADEVWGASAHLDKLADYFKDLMLAHHLIDLAPVAPTPTWKNGRGGLDLISKRLDHILISEDLLREMGRYRAWVELPFVSDHASVVVQFDYQPFPLAFPFKLNPTWLIEDDFESIVKEFGMILFISGI